MVHGDSQHYTHECDVALNSTDGHVKLYTVREAGHHTILTQRIWGETGDNGMAPHTHILDTKDRPETYAQGMVSSSLFQTMTPTRTSDELLDFDECGFYVGPCHHGMARPQVADGGTASYMEGSCE
jgi:hypothetical protein